MKYSVIIPAYNVKATLSRCLDSLVPQLPADAEVLLVNDGSNDGTEEICRSFAEKNRQIRLVSKNNGGVSSARNAGLELAAGEYVLFIDADDAVSPNYFSVLDAALKDSPDMLIFRKRLIGKNGSESAKPGRVSIFKGKLKSSGYLSKCLRRQELNLITTKAFKREIIASHGLRFDERLDIGEDKVFAFAFSLCSEKVKSISAALYCLSVETPDSLSRRKRDRLCESVLLEHRLMSDMLKETDIPAECKKMYRQALSYSFYRSAYTVVGELRKYDYSGKERRRKTKEILEAYTGETEYSPETAAGRMIAYPIRKRWAGLVRGLVRCCSKRGGV